MGYDDTLYLKILRDTWGYSDFRGIQRDIIRSIAEGKDTLGLMRRQIAHVPGAGSRHGRRVHRHHAAHSPDERPGRQSATTPSARRCHLLGYESPGNSKDTRELRARSYEDTLRASSPSTRLTAYRNGATTSDRHTCTLPTSAA